MCSPTAAAHALSHSAPPDTVSSLSLVLVEASITGATMFKHICLYLGWWGDVINDVITVGGFQARGICIEPPANLLLTGQTGRLEGYEATPEGGPAQQQPSEHSTTLPPTTDQPD